MASLLNPEGATQLNPSNKETMTDLTIGWHRIAAGHYRHGMFVARSWKKNQWWLFNDGQLRGRWRCGTGWRRYVPFKTLREAMGAVKHEHRPPHPASLLKDVAEMPAAEVARWLAA